VRPSPLDNSLRIFSARRFDTLRRRTSWPAEAAFRATPLAEQVPPEVSPVDHVDPPACVLPSQQRRHRGEESGLDEEPAPRLQSCGNRLDIGRPDPAAYLTVMLFFTEVTPLIAAARRPAWAFSSAVLTKPLS
jgi:hypothetical protein